MTTPHLFQAYSLRGITFRNRIVVSPMCQYQALDGQINEWHLAHHARFALGGVGGAVIEATGVTEQGRITNGCLGLWKDTQIDGLRKIVALYHSQNIPVGIQIGHAGRKASAALPWEGAGPLFEKIPDAAWPTVGPSAIPHSAGWPTPHALSIEEIESVISAFAAAADRAVRAGFDFVEIHGAHGYLIHSFLAPIANNRSDEYGGASVNRRRFALRVAEAVRAVVPADKPVFYRASAVDTIEGGVTLEDTIALANDLRALGIDLIDCSSGGILGPVARATTVSAPGFQVPYASAIRNEAKIPTMAVGLITDPVQAEAILASGHADLIALGRELLANSNFVYRAAVELGLVNPHEVFPRAFSFYLARRPAPYGAAKSGTGFSNSRRDLTIPDATTKVFPE